MTRPTDVEMAVEGAVVRCARIARKHGKLAWGIEAKALAEFIARDIEQITEDWAGWEEREASRRARAPATGPGGKGQGR